MNTLEIGKAITSLLGVASFAFYAPANTPQPFVTYQLLGLRPANSKDRFSYKETATVMLKAVAGTYDESVGLAQTVRDTLEPFEGEIGGIKIDEISLLDARAESSALDSYVHLLTYQITIV